LDLFVTSTDANGFSSQNELFRNNGDATFTKITGAVGGIVPGGGGSEGPMWADYDRDGFLDVFVVRYALDWLFNGNGDGSFARITNHIGIPSDRRDSYRRMWGDYDNDGWADLFVPSGYEPSGQSSLYHSLGDGTFANIVTGIMTNHGASATAAWVDYDNDGNLDLFVSRFDGSANLLYRNNGDGTFEKMNAATVGSVVSDIAQFIDCSWGDYDNDGFVDLFLTSWGMARAVLGSTTSTTTTVRGTSPRFPPVALRMIGCRTH
jgi:hypothetical protein